MYLKHLSSLFTALLIGILGWLLFVSNPGQSQSSPPDPSTISLERVWSTPPDFRVPESVKFDHVNDVLYVANINGDFNTADGNGFISTLGLEGEILDLNWVTELDAPKGMAIFDGKLYVADLRELVEIDIEGREILARYSPPGGANFMNDVTAGDDGTIYVTDSFAQRVYQLRDGEMTLLLQNPQFTNINGILFDGGRLLAGSGATGILFSIDLETLEITQLLSGFGGFDGIVPDGLGRFWVSDFGGRIFLTDLAMRFQILAGIPGNAADIEYVIEEELLLVPTFNGNQVLSYEVVVRE